MTNEIGTGEKQSSKIKQHTRRKTFMKTPSGRYPNRHTARWQEQCNDNDEQVGILRKNWLATGKNGSDRDLKNNDYYTMKK